MASGASFTPGWAKQMPGVYSGNGVNRISVIGNSGSGFNNVNFFPNDLVDFTYFAGTASSRNVFMTLGTNDITSAVAGGADRRGCRHRHHLGGDFGHHRLAQPGRDQSRVRHPDTALPPAIGLVVRNKHSFL